MLLEYFVCFQHISLLINEDNLFIILFFKLDGVVSSKKTELDIQVIKLESQHKVTSFTSNGS